MAASHGPFANRAEKIDMIAEQEAIEDEQARIEQGHIGGTLEAGYGITYQAYHILTRIQRYINPVPAVNFSFVLQISFEAAAATFQFSLINGGPASIVYGSIFSGIGTTLVALSLAEMASM